jgi:DNA-binding NarL/FixJ family response regulator
MNPNELLSFAAFSIPAFAVLSLGVGTFFFLSLKKQLRAVTAQNVETAESLERLIRIASVLETYNLESFGNRITELENRKPITVPEPSAPTFVGASRRGQVLRLHRNGESPVNIAETLGVSQGEVDLTLKLQNLFSQTVP